MSRMNLNHPEASFAGATRRLRERTDDFLNAVSCERVRHGITIGERQRTRGDDLLPAPCVLGNRSMTFPRPVCAGLASSVRQLHAGDTALRINEPDDSGQRLNVIVAPDAKILRADPTLWKIGGGLGKHQPSPAHCPAAQMDEMPVVRVSVNTGILAHRRDEHTVRKRETTNRERIKQVSHRSYTVASNHQGRHRISLTSKGRRPCVSTTAASARRTNPHRRESQTADKDQRRETCLIDKGMIWRFISKEE